jgi:hypothetical protein
VLDQVQTLKDDGSSNTRGPDAGGQAEYQHRYDTGEKDAVANQMQ